MESRFKKKKSRKATSPVSRNDERSFKSAELLHGRQRSVLEHMGIGETQLCASRKTHIYAYIYIYIYICLRLSTLTLFARFYIEGVPHNGTTTKSEQFEEKKKRGQNKKKKKD